MCQSKNFYHKLELNVTLFSILHTIQNHRTSIIWPKCTFSMTLCVPLIIFLSHGCLNPIFRWNSGPNVMSSIIVKSRILSGLYLLLKTGEDAWLYILSSCFKEVSALSLNCIWAILI